MDNVKKYFLIIVVLIVFYLSSGALAPFITGLLLAYLLYPLERKLTKYTESPLLSSVIIVLLFSIFFGFLIWFFLYFVRGEFIDILTKMPPATAKLFEFLNIKMDVVTSNAFEDLNKNFSFHDVFSKIISYFFILLYKILKGNFSFLLEMFSFFYITPVSTIIFLANLHKSDYIFKPLIPPEIYKEIKGFVITMNHLMKRYLLSQFVVSVLQIIFYYIMLSAIAVNRLYFILFIIFVSSFIPSFGSMLGILTFVLVSFIENVPFTNGIIVFILGYLYENNCLIPFFIGRNLGVSVFVIWCAVLLGGKLLGLVGLFFGIPIAAVISQVYLQRKQKLENKRHKLQR